MSYEVYEMLYSDIGEALGSTGRGVIIAAPEHELFIGDYGQIESRTLAWSAGQEDKLERFRNGADVYCDIAFSIFGYPVNKSDHGYERQIGKVADLSLGYQGGIHAFAKMGKNYDIDISPFAPRILSGASHQERKNAEYCYMLYVKEHGDDPDGVVPKEAGFAINVIKDRFREAHPNIVSYWAELENAAIKAVRTKKPVSSRGGLLWFMHDRFLWCRLPSGRAVAYPYPKVREGTRGKLTLEYYKEVNQKWIPTKTYGGSLAENDTQAKSRDIMTYAMLNLEKKYPCLFTVHDEVVSQVLKGVGDLEEFKSIMLTTKDWAKDIPLIADVWKSERYGKQ